MATRVCMYCVKEKSESEFSDEHILPHSLIKSVYCPPPFRTHDVCRACNNKSGLVVDAFYLRSYFFLNDVAMAAYDQIDFANLAPVPLTYHGIIQDVSFPEDMQCEMWLGPAGCRMYHFHHYRIEGEYASLAGGHPMDRRREPGTVYYMNCSDNPKWISLTLMSLKRAFPKSRRIATNIGFAPEVQQHYGFKTPSDLDGEFIKILNGLDPTHHLRVAVLADFDSRIMAKIALGVGCSLFGAQYFNSSFANRLRSALWARNPRDRAVLEIPGRSYLGDAQDPQFPKILGWPTGYTVAVTPIKGNGLALTLTMFGKKAMTILITDEYSRYRTDDIGAHGNISILVPSHQFWHGPIPVEQFVAHNVGSGKIPELVAADGWLKDKTQYPPKRST